MDWCLARLVVSELLVQEEQNHSAGLTEQEWWLSSFFAMQCDHQVLLCINLIYFHRVLNANIMKFNFR